MNKKCNCISAPDYHREDCTLFDTYGNIKDTEIQYQNNINKGNLRDDQTIYVKGRLSSLYSKDNREYFLTLNSDNNNPFYFYNVCWGWWCR